MVKRSSSSSDPTPPGLFDGVLARGGVREAVADTAWLAAMLEVEAALARALAGAGLMPADDAAAIERATRTVPLDVVALGRDAAATGNPVVPLVKALTAAVDGQAAGQVHRAATSQDVLDTAAMLVAQRAITIILDDLGGAADAAAALARAHRDTVMAGRTLLQQAAPITFGLKAASWMSGLDQAADRLGEVRRARLAVQFGGAVGTLAALGQDGVAVLRSLAGELGLAEPVMPWHTERTRIADIAGALGAAAGSLATVALDIVLLAQTEVGEVVDTTPGRGSSSALPNKRNPIAAVSALACARQAPGLVASLFGSMAQEHERAAGAWHAEWRPFRDLLETVGSAAAWTRDLLEHLDVDASRMRANLDLTQGLPMSESVAVALAPAIGRAAAHDLVARAAEEASTSGRRLLDVLAADAEVTAVLSADALVGALEPEAHLGSAGAFVDRALAAHDAQRRSGPRPA
jgi:3-carboxy-cis,cis-muconate cycloisomerase